MNKEQTAAIRRHGLDHFILMPCQKEAVFSAVNKALQSQADRPSRKPDRPAAVVQPKSHVEPVEAEPLPESGDSPGLQAEPEPAAFEAAAPRVETKPEIPVPQEVCIPSPSFTEGETIFREGDRADCCYVIKNGRVKLLKHGRSPKPLLIAELGPGDMFGELSVLSNTARAVTAVAEENAEVEAVNWNKLMSALQQSPKFARQVTIACSDHLKNLMDKTRALQDEMELFFQTMQEIIEKLGD